jgi:2-(1,2-epoxy-1,2-dihydrophenyl)acetyl-CoA isomerase
VAAVDGVAAAGGFGLAMCCDLVVASERAMFEWAYSKTGLTGAESSTFMLPRLVGFRRAMELVLLNPRIDAARARELGLVNDVYPAATFDEDVRRVAAKVAAGPPNAFAVAKGLINQAAGMDRLDVHLDRELEALSRIADEAEFEEGLESFFAKRAPRFGQG